MMRAAAFSAALVLCACTQQAPPTDPRVEQFARLPNWSGIWLAEGLEPGVDGFSVSRPPTLAVQSPGIPWNESAMARLQAELATNPQLQVKPAAGWGYPLMMDGPPPLQFVITPEETLIFNTYRDLRHIYTDGREHPAEGDLWPTTWGDSVGHWDGDTLVIEARNYKRWSLDDYYYQNPKEYRMHTEALRTTERLRRTDADTISYEFTVDDPKIFTKPWSVQWEMKRHPEWAKTGLYEMVCNENNRCEGGKCRDSK